MWDDWKSIQEWGSLKLGLISKLKVALRLGSLFATGVWTFTFATGVWTLGCPEAGVFICHWCVDFDFCHWGVDFDICHWGVGVCHWGVDIDICHWGVGICHWGVGFYICCWGVGVCHWCVDFDVFHWGVNFDWIISSVSKRSGGGGSHRCLV